MAFGGPGCDSPGGNQMIDEMDSRFRDRRLIEELNHQRQIDMEPQHIASVYLSVGAKPGDPSEDRDSIDGAPIAQNRQNLPHQRRAPSAIPFAEINSNHREVIRHALLSLTNFGRYRRRQRQPRTR